MEILIIISILIFVALVGRGIAKGETVNEKPTKSADITVKGGYHPSIFKLKSGVQKITFLRIDDDNCLEDIIIPELNINKYLPTGKVVTIELTSVKKGVYNFYCGMKMYKGKIIVE